MEVAVLGPPSLIVRAGFCGRTAKLNSNCLTIQLELKTCQLKVEVAVLGPTSLTVRTWSLWTYSNTELELSYN